MPIPSQCSQRGGGNLFSRIFKKKGQREEERDRVNRDRDLRRARSVSACIRRNNVPPVIARPEGELGGGRVKETFASRRFASVHSRACTVALLAPSRIVACIRGRARARAFTYTRGCTCTRMHASKRGSFAPFRRRWRRNVVHVHEEHLDT